MYDSQFNIGQQLTRAQTLFSSGIWDFDGSKSDRIGDWETRVPALKLFFSICVPLMTIVFLTWWIHYRLTRRQNKTSEVPEAETGRQ